MIGHTVGFDLAVLGRECERAGLAWRQPQTLDTRLLAEIAEPALADYLARKPGELAWRRNHGPPLGARRRARGSRCLPCARAETARKKYPHPRRGRARLPLADQRAGAAASRRLDRGDARERRGRWRLARAHRQLSVPPSRRRHHGGGALHRSAGDDRRRACRDDAEPNLVAVRRAARRRAAQTPASSPSATSCVRSPPTAPRARAGRSNRR